MAGADRSQRSLSGAVRLCGLVWGGRTRTHLAGRNPRQSPKRKKGPIRGDGASLSGGVLGGGDGGDDGAAALGHAGLHRLEPLHGLDEVCGGALPGLADLLLRGPAGRTQTCLLGQVQPGHLGEPMDDPLEVTVVVQNVERFDAQRRDDARLGFGHDEYPWFWESPRPVDDRHWVRMQTARCRRKPNIGILADKSICGQNKNQAQPQCPITHFVVATE